MRLLSDLKKLVEHTVVSSYCCLKEDPNLTLAILNFPTLVLGTLLI